MNKFLFLDKEMFNSNMMVVVNCSHIASVKYTDDTITFVLAHGNEYSFNIREIFPAISDAEVRYITKEIFCDFTRFWYGECDDDYLEDCLEFALYFRLKKALDRAMMLSIRS